MNPLETKQTIVAALSGFAAQPLAAAATTLFESLGYRSRRTLAIHSLPDLQQLLDPNHSLTEQNALLSRWLGFEFLFQITDSELAGDDRQGLLLEGADTFASKEVKSYVFLAVELAVPRGGDAPTRTELSNITRALNRLVPMPVLVLFRHGPSVSIAIINRRKNLRDGTRDVLTRISLIRDIDCRQPHRAHLDLLERFSLHGLREEAGTIRTFAQLDDAWQNLYRRIRHPQYAGFFLFLLGSSINWPTLVTLLMLPVLWVVYYRLAKQEEADALARFGDEYRRYQATSGMFWPKIWM